jgi:hypothetical protein
VGRVAEGRERSVAKGEPHPQPLSHEERGATGRELLLPTGGMVARALPFEGRVAEGRERFWRLCLTGDADAAIVQRDAAIGVRHARSGLGDRLPEGGSLIFGLLLDHRLDEHIGGPLKTHEHVR